MSSLRTTPPATVTPKKRCAVYTRKSTDEGLDQEYNSLEAQRDARIGNSNGPRKHHCGLGWQPMSA